MIDPNGDEAWRLGNATSMPAAKKTRLDGIPGLNHPIHGKLTGLLFSDVESNVPRLDGPIRDEIVQFAAI